MGSPGPSRRKTAPTWRLIAFRQHRLANPPTRACWGDAHSFSVSLRDLTATTAGGYAKSSLRRSTPSLWRMPEWVAVVSLLEFHLVRVDYCRFGMCFRRRTRFLSNLPGLLHAPILCKHDHTHTVLRGLHPSGVPWTVEAEPYPFELADILATACCTYALWHPGPTSDLSIVIDARAAARAWHKGCRASLPHTC